MTTTTTQMTTLKAAHAEAMTRATAAQAAYASLNAALADVRFAETDQAALDALQSAHRAAQDEARELGAQMDELLYGRRASIEDT
jgi:hypothetical protein